jgi:spore coat protein U-like protein
MKRLVRLALFAAIAAMPFTSAANAGTASSTFTVQATVSNNCTIAAPTLNFGAYDPIVAQATNPLNVTEPITVSCTKGDTYSIALNNGNNGPAPTGCSTTRAMSSGGAAPTLLCYDIYTNNTYKIVWNATNTVGGTSAGRAAVIINGFGQIPAAQDVGAGTYTDSVIATITF